MLVEVLFSLFLSVILFYDILGFPGAVRSFLCEPVLFIFLFRRTPCILGCLFVLDHLMTLHDLCMCYD